MTIILKFELIVKNIVVDGKNGSLDKSVMMNLIKIEI